MKIKEDGTIGIGVNHIFLQISYSEELWKTFSLITRIKYIIMIWLLPHSRLVIKRDKTNE